MSSIYSNSCVVENETTMEDEIILNRDLEKDLNRVVQKTYQYEAAALTATLRLINLNFKNGFFGRSVSP